jgi:hypothetical protein
MRKFLTCFTLLLTALMILPSGSGAQDKKDKKKPAVIEEGSPSEYAALGNMKDVLGTISAVDTAAKTMTLTIEFTHYEPNTNPNTAKTVNKATANLEAQYIREYNQIMTNKNPIAREQNMLKLQQTMTAAGVNFSKMFKSVKSSKDFNVELKDPVKVARSTLETKYDDQGEIIKYSDEQLKKMKSTDVSGAYTATPDELKVGQDVKVIFAPAKKKTVASATKDDGTTKTTIEATVTVPVVRTVIINHEPPEFDTKPNDVKKKKKN